MISPTTCLRLVLLCSAISGAGTTSAAGESVQPEDLTALMEAMAHVPSRTDRFTETKTLDILNAPLRIEGTLSYVRPDRIEKHVTAPYKEDLVVQGDALTLTDRKGGVKQIAVKSHPLIRSFVEAIRASLAGELAVLRRLYHIKFESAPQGWILTLRPLDAQAAEYLVSITLLGTGDRIETVDIVETGGDRSVMQIHGPRS